MHMCAKAIYVPTGLGLYAYTFIKYDLKVYAENKHNRCARVTRLTTWVRLAREYKSTKAEASAKRRCWPLWLGIAMSTGTPPSVRGSRMRRRRKEKAGGCLSFVCGA